MNPVEFEEISLGDLKLYLEELVCYTTFFFCVDDHLANSGLPISLNMSFREIEISQNLRMIFLKNDISNANIGGIKKVYVRSRDITSGFEIRIITINTLNDKENAEIVIDVVFGDYT